MTNKVDFGKAADFCKSLYKLGLEFPPWSDQRAQLWSQSLESFIQWFIAPELPIPQFHKEIIYALCRWQFLLVMAPRDHSKTSLIGQFYPLWRIYMDANSTLMLAASSSTVAELSLRTIKNNIETNPRLKEGFGNIKPDNPEKWTQSELIVTRDDFTLKDPTVTTVGVGGSILTRRVKHGFAVADDIVQDDEVLTELGRQRITDWLTGVLIPVLEPDEQLVVAGTAKAEGDTYDVLKKNKQFHSLIYDAIVEAPDGQWVDSLWPEKWPLDKLMARREVIGSIQFDRNYRNIVLSQTNSPFPMPWFEGGASGFRGCYDWDRHVIAEHFTTELVKVQSADLAIGKSEKSKFFVHLTLGLTKNGDILILSIVRDHIGFNDQVRLLIDKYDAFYPDWVVVEDNAYQQAVIEAVPEKAARVPIVGHTTGKNKNDPERGIMMLQPLIEAGRIRFPMGDQVSKLVSEIMVSELNRWGVANTTDTVMALWFAVTRLVSPAAQIRREVRAEVL